MIIFPVTFGISDCIIAEYRNQAKTPAIAIKRPMRKFSEKTEKTNVADLGGPS